MKIGVKAERNLGRGLMMSLPGHAEMAHQAESFRLASQLGMTGSSQSHK